MKPNSHTANETPRTDALVDEQIARARQGAGSGSQDYEELEDFARQIERELAEVRAALAGEDYASLPSDFPTVRMAHDIRSERDKFFWQVRDTCARAEKAEAALSETRRTESTLAPIRKGADPNLTTENAARIRATYEALLREVLDKSESGLTIDEGLHSRIEDAMEPKTEQPVAAAPCVAVPKDVWDWLMGENGDFEPTEEQKTSAFGPGRYWWRSELRKRVDERNG